jgi:hypothetical protein
MEIPEYKIRVTCFHTVGEVKTVANEDKAIDRVWSCGIGFTAFQ